MRDADPMLSATLDLHHTQECTCCDHAVDVIAEAVDRAIKSVCPSCRAGHPLIGMEWHEVKFTNPDETVKVYCFAAPIRRL